MRSYKGAVDYAYGVAEQHESRFFSWRSPRVWQSIYALAVAQNWNSIILFHSLMQLRLMFRR